MIGYRDIASALKKMGLLPQFPVLAHVTPQFCQQVKGSANTVLGAILSVVDNAMLPAFTYSTVVIPESGPADNGLAYGSGRESNLSAQLFTDGLSADDSYQPMADTFLHYPDSRRSSHPVLSFIGLGMYDILSTQSAAEPYGSIKTLLDLDGWVLLMGADQTSNFSIHYAEFLTGRKQFVRWALTAQGAVECSLFPGCPLGFNKLQYHLEEYKREVTFADQVCHTYPLAEIIDTASRLIRKDPYALLCSRLDCEQCNLVRKAVRS